MFCTASDDTARFACNIPKPHTGDTSTEPSKHDRTMDDSKQESFIKVKSFIVLSCT